MRKLRTDPVRLFIFDADDTLRYTTVPGQPCPHAPGEWELMPNVRERLSRFDWGGAGLRIGVASNQDHVGYGLLSAVMARRLLEELLLAAVGRITPPPGIAFCPHRIEEQCGCRKPRPGLLLELMAHFNESPSRTLFVGNAPEDRLAARLAGTHFIPAQQFFDCPAGLSLPR